MKGYKDEAIEDSEAYAQQNPELLAGYFEWTNQNNQHEFCTRDMETRVGG